MWKALFSAIGHFICGTVSFIRTTIFISYLAILVTFGMAIAMPENVQKAIEIFTKLLGG